MTLASLTSLLTAAGPSLWNGATASLLGLFLVRLTIVAGLGCLVLLAAPRWSAASRHLVALVTLVAALLLPPAMALLPALPVHIALPPSAAVEVPAPAATSARPVKSALDQAKADKKRPAVTARPARVRGAGVATTGRGFGLGAFRVSLPPIAPALPFVLLAALVGSLAIGFIWLHSIVAGVRLVRQASDVVDPELRDEFERARTRLGIRGDVRLGETDRLDIPVVWGALRPMLLLPAGVPGWPRERQRVVLLHELAHIARRDGLSALVARAAGLLFWFHPLVWVLVGAVRRECEQACDDVVLASGERPSSYAAHLLAIARDAWASDPLGGLAPAFARRSKLEQRLAAILRPDARREPATKRTVALYALAALLVVIPVATGRVLTAQAKSAARIELAGSKDPGEWFETGRTNYEQGHYDVAAWAYLRAAAGGYRDDTAYYNAACSFALDDQKDEALLALDHALNAGFDNLDLVATDSDLDSIRSDPRFEKLARGAGVTDRAEQLKRSALATFDELGREHSDDAGEWGNVGVRLMRLGEYERARQAFSSQFAIDGSANSLYNGACATALAGNRPQALDLLERSILAGYSDSEHMLADEDLRALRREPRLDELVTLSDDLELNSSFRLWDDDEGWREVIPRYESMTRKHPTVGRAWFNLGFAQLKGGDPAAAAESYRKTLDLEYREPTSMYNLACCYAQLHRPDEALDWLGKAEAAGLEVGGLAENDEDLDPLRHDARFQKLSDRWQREMRASWRYDFDDKDKRKRDKNKDKDETN